MISAVYLINLKGEVLIFRSYRDDVSRAAADAFRMQVRNAANDDICLAIRVIFCVFNDMYQYIPCICHMRKQTRAFRKAATSDVLRFAKKESWTNKKDSSVCC